MVKKNYYDCIIIGAGPAGIFSALKLSENNKISTLLLEKGHPLKRRICPSDGNGLACKTCNLCAKTTGWGGAGAFSDGKLNIATTNLGVGITDFINLSDFQRLVSQADELWLKFGAPKKVYGKDSAQIRKIKRITTAADLDFKVSPIRHLGTENSSLILQNMYDFLSPRVAIKFGAKVNEIIVSKQKKVQGVVLEDGSRYYADYVLISPGREGAAWLDTQAQKLGLRQVHRPVELGVRVEVASKVMRPVTDVLYEAKLSYKTKTFSDFIRTFCMCPNGFVSVENADTQKKIRSVNGHSYINKKSKNTNFALLVRTDFTYPFKEPNLYGGYITGLANLLSGSILVQRLGDLLAGRRSTPKRIKEGRIRPTLKSAVPGDLAFALPYRHLTDILEMLRAMDKVTPGVFSFDTLLYGVEVKFFSSSLKLTKHLETEVANLFACGDGAGVSRNLVHASVSGLLAAEEILKRKKI
jgi:uncharacterized FAD-dependent dehydrogenase